MAEVSHVWDSYMCDNLIIEAGNPRNHRPKFQAEFHVPEEEPDAHSKGLSRDVARASATTQVVESRKKVEEKP